MGATIGSVFLTYAVPVGVLLGACTASLTLFLVTLRGARNASTKELLSVYEEFWTDTYIDVRKWVAIDEAYVELAAVLNRRDQAGGMASLTATEYETLEKLDWFLVMFVRVENLKSSFAGSGANSKHIRDFVAYWQSMISQRPELATYVSKNWPILTRHDSWGKVISPSK